MTSIDETRLAELIALAKSEDLGSGDITTALLDDPNRSVSFELTAKARGVFPSGVTHDSRYLEPYPLFIDRAAGSRVGPCPRRTQRKLQPGHTRPVAYFCHKKRRPAAL